MREERPYLVWLVVALMLLPPCAYVGGYVALVERALLVYWDIDRGLTYDPVYRVQHSALKRVFWPIHQIDRRIRPAYWEPGFDTSSP